MIWLWKRYIRRTTDFSPLVIWRITPKIRKLVGNVQTFEKNMTKLTYSLTVNVLMLIFWITLPGSSMWKVLSIMPSNLHWVTVIQSRNDHLENQNIYISLVLVARLMEIWRLSIPLSKIIKLAWRKIRWLILDVFNRRQYYT